MGEPEEIGGLLPKGLSQAVAVYNVVCGGYPGITLLRSRMAGIGAKASADPYQRKDRSPDLSGPSLIATRGPQSQ